MFPTLSNSSFEAYGRSTSHSRTKDSTRGRKASLLSGPNREGGRSGSSMSHALLHQLNLRRGLYLWACFRLEFLEVAAFAHGEIAFLFGTEDDPNRPVVYLDTLNLVIDEADELGGRGGTPSACLLPGSRPRVEFDSESRRFGASFEAMVDFPAVRREGKEREADPETDTPGPAGLRAGVELRGQFLSELRPVEYGSEMLEAEMSITLPPQVEELHPTSPG